jgi:uncharacterized membrane protein
MRNLLGGLFVAGLLLVAGCSDNRTPGGPGKGGTGPDTGTRVTQEENTFTLKPPLLEQDIKQGETKAVKISINRGRNFDQDVKLEFSNAPQGVKIHAPSEIKASDKEVEVKIEASNEAALGEHTVLVKGKPAREGAEATAKMKIEVKKP